MTRKLPRIRRELRDRPPRPAHRANRRPLHTPAGYVPC